MSNYLDEAQRLEVKALAQSFIARTEWPTWLLLICVYTGWFSVILYADCLGLWLSTGVLILIVALWQSLQHELLHGHPTRLNALNKVLGYAPFAVWYPYTLYRDRHLLHHNDEDLTVPGVDPESRYLNQQQWADSSLFWRSIHWLNKTLLGRFLLGPPLFLWRTGRNEFRRLIQGQKQAWLMWLTHGAVLVLMLTFIAYYSAIPVWHYLALVSVPSIAVTSIRSFYEHRPHPQPEQRTVLNEASWGWGLLFLNNNLHLVHHDLPKLPWYVLPMVYRTRREQWIARSGGFLVQGYGQLISRHGLKTIDNPRHPYL